MTTAVDKIQRANILEETWHGVVQKLTTLYSSKSGVVSGRNVQVVPAANSENFEQLLLKKGMELKLPVIAVSPVNYEPDFTSYNTNVMRRFGYVMQISEDRANWRVAKLAPVIATYQVMIATDDVVTMTRMVDRWMSNELWGFETKFPAAEWQAKIKVVADKNLAVPPSQPSSGGAEQYRLTGTLRASTYAGFIWLIPAIRKFELDAMFPDGNIEEALNDPATDAQVVMTRSITTDPTTGEVVFMPAN